MGFCLFCDDGDGGSWYRSSSAWKDRRSQSSVLPTIHFNPHASRLLNSTIPIQPKTVNGSSSPVRPYKTSRARSKHNQYDLDSGVLPEREKAASEKNGRKKI